MLDLLRATRRCFVYAPVRLRHRELLSMASAAGFELQADSEALWITVDSESRDIFLAPGEQFRIRASGTRPDFRGFRCHDHGFRRG